MDRRFCQAEDLLGFSERVRGLMVVAYQLEWYVKNRGMLATLKRLPVSLALRARRILGLQGQAPKRKAAVDEEVLDLQPGEIVEVKSEEEIRRTLDERDRLRGLFFASGMTEYCNRKMRVLKRVARICLDDKPGEVRRIRHTVLLEDAMCNGTIVGCDRSCFYFWREAWLRRTPASREVSPDRRA